MTNRRYITFEERQTFERLLEEGFSIAEIAKKTKRRQSSVWHEITKNGMAKFYSAVEAQKNSDQTRIVKNEVIKEKNILRNQQKTTLEKRISMLEMQIDILLDKIRSIENGKN